MFQQPQAPGDARPIIDPDTGKIVGYSGKDIHMMPQPKESPEDYETEVTKTPGTKGTEGEPGLQVSLLYVISEDFGHRQLSA